MKTIVFDFDGTLTKKSNEIWKAIWTELNALDIDNALYNKYKNRELDYGSWCYEIEKEFIKRKFNKKTLYKLINNIQLMDNLDNTLYYLKNKGYSFCIVSGGIDYVINSLLKNRISFFNEINCCKFSFDNKGYLKKIISTNYDDEGKALYIKEFSEKNNIPIKDIIFIGNGDNDEYVSSSGCTTICINPSHTDHLNKDIWHHYIENTNNLNDIIKIIDLIENNK